MVSVIAEGVCQRNKGNTEKSHFMSYSSSYVIMTMWDTEDIGNVLS